MWRFVVATAMLILVRVAISRHRAVIPVSPMKSSLAHVTTFIGSK
jgi:hypothetical protein